MTKIVKLIKSVFIILTLFVISNGQVPNWYFKLKQVKIFETNRQEVEKLFNNPQITDDYSGDTGQTIKYKLTEGQLTVTYSRGNCFGNRKYVYDVEKDLVTNFNIDLKKDINISKLDLKLESFKKTEIYDLPGVFNYYSEDKGEYYLTSEYFKDGNIKVRNLRFFPAKNQKKLSCINLENN